MVQCPHMGTLLDTRDLFHILNALLQTNTHRQFDERLQAAADARLLYPRPLPLQRDHRGVFPGLGNVSRPCLADTPLRNCLRPAP